MSFAARAPISKAPCGESVLRCGGAELPHDGPFADFLASFHASNILAVPIVSSNREIEAILAFVYTNSGRVYDEDDEPYAEEIAQRAAMTIEQARLFADRGAAIRARDNLLAVVSHDLRSPLSAIRLSAGMLAQAPATERRRTKKQVDVILRATVRMERLISDLLAAATIEAGAFTVEKRPGLVEDVLDELFNALEALAAEKQIRLERGVEDGLPPIDCDRQRLVQALVNVAGNAR